MNPFSYTRRALATVRNAAEVVRLGGLDTDEQSAPFTVEAEQLNYRLRHYHPDLAQAGDRPILLVPPLMMTAEVWDVSPATSAVSSLRAAGIDPWVVDFGDPSREPGGVERTLTDHVIAVSDAVDRVYAATGRDVLLAGYSQGGMFAYQATALRRSKNIDSLITFGSPVDTTAPLPIPVSPERVAALAANLVESGVLSKLTLPAWAVRVGFKLISPAKTVQGRVQFLLALHDRDALLPRERQRRFLDSEGWTAYSGPAIAEFLEQFVAHNRMLEGGFVIEDRLVTLADIEVPVLSVVGTTDTIGHPDSVRGIDRATPRADVYELTLPAGHFGLVVGSTASSQTWPAVIAWAHWRDGDADLPADIVPAADVESSKPLPSAAAEFLGQAADLSLDATRIALGTARRAVRTARDVVAEAPAQLPRLARLNQLNPNARISLGSMLDEQAAKRPADVCFLFGDRAYRQREVKYRVDSVAKGLIGAGVRHGDRVGVLMGTRPSAFTLVAGLSRLGATAVLLRPDGDLLIEANLGRASWVISDPEHADGASRLDGVRWGVLGNSGSDRSTMSDDVIDLELIDPETVRLPAWYRANPLRASDIAYVVFTGEKESTRAVRISNGRWARSALGTASAAALRPGDTVYSTTPHHHSSALLMSVGGAVAGGARFAMAAGTDPATFWTEVRRYGATHVSYTWSSLREITSAPPDPNELHQPIRMFMGSGMPANLWRRVVGRFPTSRVLEFYASAEGQAILANISGSPIGSLGAPLPGTPEVRIAAYDQQTRSLEIGPDGLARECRAGEVGLLLERVGAGGPGSGAAGSGAGEFGGAGSGAGGSGVGGSGALPPFRSLFEPGDAWQSTGDLFRRDDQDQLWLYEAVAALITTEHGVVAPGVARRAVEAIPGVDLSVAYGVPVGSGSGGAKAEVLVVAVTLRPGAELTGEDLARVCGPLPEGNRPDYVQVVPSIPLTTWSRPIWRALREAGLPEPAESRTVWKLDAKRSGYRKMARPRRSSTK